ncbi:MAG: hypothetical protein JNL83_39050 [Myxococcales bacterium]|nr:hypothetical protein [Myxococcales bacterium]
MWGAVLLAGALSACSFEVAGSRTVDAAGDRDAAGGPDGSPVTPDAPDPAPQSFHLRIEALIDGESHLHIKGTTVWWQHYIYAAPGRWDADGAAPWDIAPVKLNGVDWLPTWPDQPTPENRSCNGCLSNATQLAVGVPRVPSTVTWTEVQTRRAQGITQYPSAANDWELIVLISDYGVGGAAPYIVDVDATVP